MKKYLPLFVLLVFCTNPGYAGKGKQEKGYRISVMVTNLTDSVIKLANYYGSKKYVKDSARIDKDGFFVFSGEEPLPGGIYIIVFSDKSYFELLVTESQHFSMQTDVRNYVGKMKVEGSEENTECYKYLLYMAEHGSDLRHLSTELEKEDLTDTEKKKLREQKKEITGEVQDFKLKFIETHPDHFISKVFTTSKEIKIPEAPELPEGGTDSLFPYNYYKQHFFDFVDFSDERLLRTPVFHERLFKYMNKVILQHPDSLISGADRVLKLASANDEVFKYTLVSMLNKYASPKIMGQDAVYVHLVENYYATGKATWIDSTLLYRITEQAKDMKPLLLGKPAPNFRLRNLAGRYVSLYETKAEYTILVFWDPDCGHCKKKMPKLKPMVDRLEGFDIKVHAVNTESDTKLWREFLDKYDMHENWINVEDTGFNNYFRQHYDISSTPNIYLLDKDKKIIAKKLTIIQLEQFIRDRQKMKETEEEKKSN